MIKRELLVIVDKYGDERKTSIGFDVFDISTEDLIPRENVVITMTKLGYIKRMTEDNSRARTGEERASRECRRWMMITSTSC